MSCRSSPTRPQKSSHQPWPVGRQTWIWLETQTLFNNLLRTIATSCWSVLSFLVPKFPLPQIVRRDELSKFSDSAAEEFAQRWPVCGQTWIWLETQTLFNDLLRSIATSCWSVLSFLVPKFPLPQIVRRDELSKFVDSAAEEFAPAVARRRADLDMAWNSDAF